MIKPHGGKLINRIASEKERKEILSSKLPTVQIDKNRAVELENIGTGVLSPLEGFMNEDDFESVIRRGRLTDDLAWTIPIVLDIKEQPSFKIGDTIILEFEDTPMASMEIESIFKPDKKRWVENVFGTNDTNHPGVKKIFELGNWLIGGKIKLLNQIKHKHERYYLTPIETRVLFKEKGWKTVVGFQTRNAPHIGHEYVQKTALTFVDGLFINPVIGKKKPGDFKDEVILAAYDVLMKEYYLKDNAVLSILPFEMRYAGPREAILHAIIRKNYGCTHFIIGRDHAGVGNYYGPYDAQKIFEKYPDLGITPLFFRSFFYCKKCSSVVNEKICPHPKEYHINFSGTKMRQLLIEGKKPDPILMRPEVVDTILKFKNPFVGEEDG